MTFSLSSHGEQKLTPQPLLDMNYAFARTALLVAAVRLHLFTYLSKKALTSAKFAARADVVPKPDAEAFFAPRVIDLFPVVFPTMLVNTAQGRIRTVSEIATWLIESGLQDVQQFRAVGPFPVVVARKGEER